MTVFCGRPWIQICCIFWIWPTRTLILSFSSQVTDDDLPPNDQYIITMISGDKDYFILTDGHIQVIRPLHVPPRQLTKEYAIGEWSPDHQIVVICCEWSPDHQIVVICCEWLPDHQIVVICCEWLPDHQIVVICWAAAVHIMHNRYKRSVIEGARKISNYSVFCV